MTRPAAASIVSLASLLATSSYLLVAAFSPQRFHGLKPTFQTQLNYRSMYHGPDVEPLTELEKLGASATKMDKDKIQRYGPGDFTQYADDGSQDIFDGGDSEMGLSGDGILLKKIGRDVTPHMTRTLSSKTDQVLASRIVSYTDELLENNPHMDIVRAQQLENWATQQEISKTNRYMNMRGEVQQGRNWREYYVPNENEDEVRISVIISCFFQMLTIKHYDLTPDTCQLPHLTKDKSILDHLTQPGDDVEGIVSLRAPVNSVAAHEFAVSSKDDFDP